MRGLQGHFQELFNKHIYDQGDLDEVDSVQEDVDNDFRADFLVNQIIKDEVEWAIGSLKSNKSCGYHDIPADLDVIKNKLTCDFLECLFNICFSKSCSPSAWKKGIIIPIPKKPHRHSPEC